MDPGGATSSSGAQADRSGAATRIRLCGPLRLEIEGRDVISGLRAGQARTVVAYLLANRDRPTERDALVDALWPRDPPKDPHGHLRPILSRVRRALEPGGVEGRERLRVTLPSPVWSDVDEASEALARARDAVNAGEWRAALERAERAAELLAPGFLPGEDADWAAQRRGELEELELEALECVARSGLQLDTPQVRAAEAAARELVARSPFRESGYLLLMQALAAAGNSAEALRVYEELRQRLRDELGVAPAREVQELHAKLVGGESAVGVASQPAWAPPPLPATLAARDRQEFIGRERELEELVRAWELTREGRRRLVVLTGEPGIGKTRLTSELALAAHGDATVLYAACQPEALISYQPFVEALRHYVRSQPDAMLSGLGPGAAELGRLIPELAARTDLAAEPPSPDPETRRYLMFDAVAALLSRACSQGPVLFVLDDLHWADPPTLKLLRHVVGAQDETPLMILGTYREAEVGAGHPLFELLADLRRDRPVVRISLDGLDRGDVASLIASQAGREAPGALVRAVHSETRGNPFFVEEVMRHLIETGAVFEREGRWASDIAFDEIGVPEGVKDVLERRLSHLSPESRDLLVRAAVLGREFGFDTLAAMSGAADETLISGLEEALGARLIVEARAAPRPVYSFTHALVRETLYGGLSAPRRERLHAEAAGAIERRTGPDGDGQVAALAVHHRLAGPAGDPAKAIEFSLRAGDQARALYAWEEASGHWAGALAVMEREGADPAARARLLLGLADLMPVIGDLGRQIEYLEQALELYEAIGDDERSAQVHSRLGMATSLIDSIFAEHLDIGRAFQHFDAARKVLDRGPVRAARGHLETGVATALTYGLDIPHGAEAAQRGMEIAEEVGDEATWTGAAEAYAWHRIVGGDLSGGFELVERAFRAADEGKRYFLAWMATTMRGHMTWGLGDPDAAQPLFERAIALPYAGQTTYHQQDADGLGRCHASRGEMAAARELVSDARPSWVTHSLAPLMDVWAGRWDRVEALASQILDTSRRNGNRWDEWASHHLRARAAQLLGDPARALADLERALPIVSHAGAEYFELWVLTDLARVRAESGLLAQGRECVDRVAEILDGGEDWRGRRGHADTAAGVVLAHEGELDESLARFEAATATFHRYRVVGEEADALHQWGLALERAGDRAGAGEKLGAALGIYRRHEAGDAWIRRIEQDRSRL